MLIGVPKEVHREERRVAATPSSVDRLTKLGYSVMVEAGAGAAAAFTDEAYREAGAEIVERRRDLWGNADLVLKVRGPEPHPALGMHEVDMMRDRGHLIGFIWPAQNPDLLDPPPVARGDGAGGRCHPAHLSRAKVRCPEFHGKYRRLPRRRGSDQPFRPFLRRPDDGGG